MSKTPDYFVGKTIIITGAASGIGRAAALVFAREGANVVCADINADGTQQTAERVIAQGSKALALRTDVTSRKDVNEMIRRTIDSFGNVQFQFNSAGAALRRSKFLDIDDALFDDTFSLNVKGTFHCMQAILPHMLVDDARGRARVRAERHPLPLYLPRSGPYAVPERGADVAGTGAAFSR